MTNIIDRLSTGYQVTTPPVYRAPRWADSTRFDYEVSTPYERGFDHGVAGTGHRFKGSSSEAQRAEYEAGYEAGVERAELRDLYSANTEWED